ncbi:cytidine/deoxycytidylate deaminase family protein [Carboxydocella sp. JDF658]|uniref:deoxycytidylate deaminase n=2 Tax=unclassified Carboxydocella TaxID=2685367 RepID=UPI0009AD6878|nr:cytidine/deoxycytidylate deaminase family protein [Carboxydocella sp. JDF658]GAW31410.1 dCMP deaminase [Carboxydocella sp. JDF658]
MNRPSWDEYFMEIARTVASRSTCLRRQVGAVIARDNRILTTGYNGAPQGLRHCLDRGGCRREQLQIPSGERHELCLAVHAEQNAIIQGALHGVELAGATLYATTQPCVLCAKMLINAGIRRIVFLGDYPDPFARELLVEAGVELCRLKEEKLCPSR